jgi:hypothetical protein
MTAQIIPLISRINSLEQQIRDLNNEKRGLERELNRFAIGDDAVAGFAEVSTLTTAG